RHILEPSWKINEKFQTWIFVTDEGKVVTGMVLEENDETVKLIENPLAKTPPITLRKSDVEDRKKSPTSLMPKGLLDRLRREEILDLLAYVISGGKADHMFFQHHH
ncbi:MAG TPA: hypothetical protein VMM56_00080, partial [Planctomycetaceae bacterium]|nr:hypothetical protein [Planctomycetaceae bacterium]